MVAIGNHGASNERAIIGYCDEVVILSGFEQGYFILGIRQYEWRFIGKDDGHHGSAILQGDQWISIWLLQLGMWNAVI